jgi:predicted DNA-binding protein YlxM (UPF0122 family)
MSKVSQLIINRILKDNDFSMALAKKLGIQQQSVMGLARRNSSKLTLYDAIQLYKEYGFKEEDILLKSTK